MVPFPLPDKCLVSACLVGLCTRYDGRSKPSPECRALLSERHWIPVCPEQLGGLPTPRPPADLVGGDGHAVLAGTARVVDVHGRDVTEPFVRGAFQVLDIALAQHIDCCLLKARSPSCGLSPVAGVTTALLLSRSIRVCSF